VLGIKQAGDAIGNIQIKDETVIGGAAEVVYPISVTDRVQARPFGVMHTGLKDLARIGVDVYFGALGSTPAMSRDPVTGHRYPVNVEQTQDRGILFSLGHDDTQVEKSRFLPSDSNASHEPICSRTRMGVTFKRGLWSVFDGLTMMGKEFKEQNGEQVSGSIRLLGRF
jgi:hypothetical protein